MKRQSAIVLGVGLTLTFAPTAHAFPVVGGNGLVPDAWALVQWAQDNYPGITSVGGVRADHLPDHPSGHAVDLMVPNLDYGDQVYAAVMENRATFNVRYVLWRVPNHYNHVHVTVD